MNETINDFYSQLPLKSKFVLFSSENKTTYSKIAEKLGISYSFFNQIMNGHRRANIELAEKIVAITQGRITLEDLRKVHIENCPSCGQKIRKHRKL